MSPVHVIGCTALLCIAIVSGLLLNAIAINQGWGYDEEDPVECEIQAHHKRLVLAEGDRP